MGREGGGSSYFRNMIRCLGPRESQSPSTGLPVPQNTLLCCLIAARRTCVGRAVSGPQIYDLFKAREQKGDGETILDDHKIMSVCEWERH